MKIQQRIQEWRDDYIRQQSKSRLSRVSSGELMTWAESAINGFHRDMDLYRSHYDQAALKELRKAVSMLAGAVDVLEQRNQP